MGRQSTAKTVFLLASMVGWLAVGAALMYLFPLMAHALVQSDLTQTWLETLTRSGYNPWLAYVGGGGALIVTVAGNLIWYRYFDQRFSQATPSDPNA